jgi:hypothetical protein
MVGNGAACIMAPIKGLMRQRRWYGLHTRSAYGGKGKVRHHDEADFCPFSKYIIKNNDSILGIRSFNVRNEQHLLSFVFLHPMLTCQSFLHQFIHPTHSVTFNMSLERASRHCDLLKTPHSRHTLHRHVNATLHFT